MKLFRTPKPRVAERPFVRAVEPGPSLVAALDRPREEVLVRAHVRSVHGNTRADAMAVCIPPRDETHVFVGEVATMLTRVDLLAIHDTLARQGRRPRPGPPADDLVISRLEDFIASNPPPRSLFDDIVTNLLADALSALKERQP